MMYRTNTFLMQPPEKLLQIYHNPWGYSRINITSQVLRLKADG